MNNFSVDPAELLSGAIDCYVHANPDPVARLGDDLELARACAGAGLSAAIHRHHFFETAGRGSVVRAATGFPLLGALILGDAVGGVNPMAVEVALDFGAVWVGLPTLSAQNFRAGLASRPAAVRGPLSLGSAQLRLTDATGRLTEEVQQVIRLVADSNAALGLGYGDAGELRALAGGLKGRGVQSVLTYPHISGLSEAEISELVRDIDCFVEVCIFRMLPTGASGGGQAALTEALRLIELAGPDHCIISSDSGIAGSPDSPAMLDWGLRALHDAGVSGAHLRRFVHDNPRRLLGGRAPGIGG